MYSLRTVSYTHLDVYKRQTCNNEENRSKRVEIKELIKNLKQVNPYVESNIFKSVENVNLDTVISYKKSGEKHHCLDDYDR